MAYKCRIPQWSGVLVGWSKSWLIIFLHEMENWTNVDKINKWIGFLMRQKDSDRVVYWYHLLNVAGAATSKSVASLVNIARARSVTSKRWKCSKSNKCTHIRGKMLPLKQAMDTRGFSPAASFKSRIYVYITCPHFSKLPKDLDH